MSSPQRSPALADVPAIAEQVPGYSGTLWVGLFAPRGIPADVETKLKQGMVKVLADPATQQALETQGVERAKATPEQFAAQLDEDIARWAKIVQAAGAKVD